MVAVSLNTAFQKRFSTADNDRHMKQPVTGRLFCESGFENDGLEIQTYGEGKAVCVYSLAIIHTGRCP
jgi:hypothetical protein